MPVPRLQQGRAAVVTLADLAWAALSWLGFFGVLAGAMYGLGILLLLLLDDGSEELR